MSIRHWIESKRGRDKEIMQQARVRYHDPEASKYAAHYTHDDIRRLEEEKAPWLKRRRRG